MGLYFYNIDDPKDKVADIVTNPVGHARATESHQFADALRRYHWDNRRITSHGTYFGDPNYQWVAHIPGHVAELLDMRHPGWDTDEKTMREILQLYPECKCLPEDPRA